MFGIFMIVIFAFGFFIFIMFVKALARAFGQSGGQSFQYRPSNFGTRTGTDGFWLTSAAVAAGALVYYRYRCGGEWRHGSAIYQPGTDGHFIYTGQGPESVEILRVDDPEEDRRRRRRDDDDIGTGRPDTDYSSSGAIYSSDSNSDSGGGSFSSGPSAY